MFHQFLTILALLTKIANVWKLFSSECRTNSQVVHYLNLGDSKSLTALIFIQNRMKKGTFFNFFIKNRKVGPALIFKNPQQT